MVTIDIMRILPGKSDTLYEEKTITIVVQIEL